jgi:tetratricopeptide (TPR) repeat protein
VLIACTAYFGTPYTPSLESYFKKANAETIIAPSDEAVSVNRLEEGGSDSGEIRKIVWAGAFNVWKRFPLLGSGVETFAYSYYFDRPMEHNTVSEWDHLYNKAHNELLNFLATTGLVGFAAYLFYLGALIGLPVYFALSRKEQSAERTLPLLAISTGLVGLTVSNALGFSTVMVGVLLTLSGAWSWHLYQDRNQAHQPETFPKENELEPTQMLWLVVTLLCVCVALILVWRTWKADHLFAKGKALNRLGQYAVGLEHLEQSYNLSNGEGVFMQELAEVYSWVSAGFYQVDQATAAAAYREVSKGYVDQMMLENPYNLNYYKTKSRILAVLAAQEPKLLLEAKETLEQAVKLAPTDPRVRYNLGLIELSLGATESAKAHIMAAIEMRPTFAEAVQGLEKIEELEASASSRSATPTK